MNTIVLSDHTGDQIQQRERGRQQKHDDEMAKYNDEVASHDRWIEAEYESQKSAYEKELEIWHGKSWPQRLLYGFSKSVAGVPVVPHLHWRKCGHVRNESGGLGCTSVSSWDARVHGYVLSGTRTKTAVERENRQRTVATASAHPAARGRGGPGVAGGKRGREQSHGIFVEPIGR